MHKLIAEAISKYRSGDAEDLPEAAMEVGSSLYAWLQEQPADFIFIIPESSLPIPDDYEIDDYFLPEDYDTSKKVVELMQDQARAAQDDCTTVNVWSVKGLLLSYCMDLEGYEPIFHSFTIYRSKTDCLNDLKANGYVAVVDDRIVSHSNGELCSLFEKRVL